MTEPRWGTGGIVQTQGSSLREQPWALRRNSFGVEYIDNSDQCQILYKRRRRRSTHANPNKNASQRCPTANEPEFHPARPLRLSPRLPLTHQFRDRLAVIHDGSRATVEILDECPCCVDPQVVINRCQEVSRVTDSLG